MNSFAINMEITQEEAIPLLKLLEREFLPRDSQEEYEILVNFIRKLRDFIDDDK